MKVSVSQLKIFILFFLLYILFGIVYYNIISSVFSYEGYNVNFTKANFIIGFLLFVYIIWVHSFVKVSDIVRFTNTLVLLFWIIPSFIQYQFNYTEPRLLIVSFQVLLFFILFFVGKLPFKYSNAQLFTHRRMYFLVLIVTLVCISPFLIHFYPYINFNNLLLKDVYETRALVSKQMNPYFSYTYGVISKVFLPISIVISFYYRFLLIGFLLACLMIFMFLVGAHKLIFFGFLIIVLFYWIESNLITTWLLRGLILVILLGLCSYYFYSDIRIISIAIRRPFFLPSLLDEYYFTFFNGHYTYYSQSINIFLDYPYDRKVSMLIGNEFFDSEVMSANNGLFSDGYANLGLIGVLINVILFALVILHLQFSQLSPKFFGLFLILFFSFFSSSFFTVLVTHGALFFMLLVPVLLSKRSYDKC